MGAKKDYYEVLGCDKSASDDELKKAYRKLSMQLHPDRQVGKTDAEKKEAEEKFKEVNEAYAVLSDPAKRSRYDAYGFEDDQPSFGPGPGFSPFEFFHQTHSGFGPFGFEEEMPDGFHFQKPDPNQPKAGRDIKINMTVNFAEAIHGVNKEFDISANTFCTHCNGTGAEDGQTMTCPSCHGSGIQTMTQRRGMMVFQQQTTCPHCRGEGYVASKTCTHCHGSKSENIKKHLNVNLPAGVFDGATLRVRGKGCDGLNGGPSGDLIVYLHVEKSPIFERISPESLDLKMSIYIDPITASLGGKAECMTPYGECNINIPAGISSDKMLRLAGKGIKVPSGATGDLYVEVKIQPIVNISTEQKKLLEKLQKTISARNVKDLTMQQSEYARYNSQREKL